MTMADPIACPICRFATYDIAVVVRPHNKNVDGEYSIVKCRQCECIYLNPTLTREGLSRAYSVIQSKGSAIRSQVKPDKKPSLLARWWRRYCSYQVDEHIEVGPVLDLGCNDGELMRTLQAKGLETFGVEFSSEAVEACRLKSLNVEEADLEDLILPAEQFKTIVLSHVLEHLPNPIEMLKRIREGLSIDGTIVMCVPNVDSPIRKLFGANWHGWDPPFHLVHYNQSSLRAVCEQADLQVIRIVRRMIPDDLGRSLSLRKGGASRNLLIRIIAFPIFAILSATGFGSYLLIIAQKTEPQQGFGIPKD